MAGLGYDRYGAQGGDWGSMISTQLGAGRSRARRRRPPQHDRGAATRRPRLRQPHATTSRPRWRRSTTTAASIGVLRRSRARSRRPSATRSTTRPPGWRRGSSRSSGRGATATATSSRCFTKDQLLDNIMLYWLTGTAHSAGRLYYEAEQTAGVRARPSGSRSRSAWRRSPRRSSVRPGTGRRAATTSATGPRCRAAGTSRRSSSPSCSSTTCGSFFRTVR